MRIAMRVVTTMLTLALTAGFAHADVIYSFVGQYPDVNDVLVPASFTITVPAPLSGTGATGFNPDFQFTPGASLVCNECVYVNFYKDAVAHGLSGFIPSDAFGFGVVTSSGPSEPLFYFDPNAVLTDGTHNSIILSEHSGTLTVSGVNAQVPEPPVLSLLVLAFALLGGVAYSQGRLI